MDKSLLCRVTLFTKVTWILDFYIPFIRIEKSNRGDVFLLHTPLHFVDLNICGYRRREIIRNIPSCLIRITSLATFFEA